MISAPIRKKIDQLGWGNEDIFKSFTNWKKEYVLEESSLDIELKKQKEVVSALFDKKGEEAAQLEESLKSAFEAGKVRSLKILDQMSRKLRKAEERRLDIQITRALAIQDYMNPGGAPQERVVNMMQFYLEDESLIECCLDCFDPLDFKMMVLDL